MSFFMFQNFFYFVKNFSSLSLCKIMFIFQILGISLLAGNVPYILSMETKHELQNQRCIFPMVSKSKTLVVTLLPNPHTHTHTHIHTYIHSELLQEVVISILEPKATELLVYVSLTSATKTLNSTRTADALLFAG